MTFETELVLLPEAANDINLLAASAAAQLNIPVEEINTVQILKRSIDARGRQPVFRMKVKVFAMKFRNLKY